MPTNKNGRQYGLPCKCFKEAWNEQAWNGQTCLTRSTGAYMMENLLMAPSIPPSLDRFVRVRLRQGGLSKEAVAPAFASQERPPNVLRIYTAKQGMKCVRVMAAGIPSANPLRTPTPNNHYFGYIERAPAEKVFLDSVPKYLACVLCVGVHLGFGVRLLALLVPHRLRFLEDQSHRGQFSITPRGLQYGRQQKGSHRLS
ncbi:hypothetical protein BP00DRAFT_474546 [Aspergillus indologenus CBS 114.80]|uniref:Uncharacterized protein n=1 Tax=Aspergillus indologenus CBS 114.80 TaxID=1450541 RepID=A0A2V5J2Y4_9EURO|nr:hypothetical protein BP00DRAFT_474546 [Aspergillus indologenus CBS 114.80]